MFAIGNAPLIPSIARLDGFDVVHLHYPFIFGAELTLLGRLRSAGAAPALLVHYKNRLSAGRRAGAVRGLRAHRRAAADPRRRPHLRALRRPRRVGPLPAPRPASAGPERVIEMPNGVDTEPFSPGPTRAALRARLGIPADAVVAAFVATLDRAHHFKRLDVAIEALARTPTSARPPGRRRRRRAARRLSRRGRGRRRRRPRPLPRPRPPRRAARRAARLRPLPADHRAAGVVRDRPDRGDGLRAPGGRDRLPRRPRRGRRRRDRRPRAARRPGAPSPAALDRLRRGAGRGARDARASGPREGEREWAGRACSTAWTTPTREAIDAPGAQRG